VSLAGFLGVALTDHPFLSGLGAGLLIAAVRQRGVSRR